MKYILSSILLLFIFLVYYNCETDKKNVQILHLKDVGLFIKLMGYGENGRIYFSHDLHFNNDHIDYCSKGKYLELYYDAHTHLIYAFDRDSAVVNIKQEKFIINKVNLIHKDSLRTYVIDEKTYQYPSFGEWSDSTVFKHPRYHMHITYSNSGHTITVYDSTGIFARNVEIIK